MHRIIWKPAEREHVSWTSPDGLVRLNHRELADAGGGGLVLIGDQARWMSRAQGARALEPHRALRLPGGSLTWEPAQYRGGRFLPGEETRGERHPKGSPTFTLVGPDGRVNITEEAPVVVGRHPSCDLVLSGRRMSGIHCAVLATPEGLRVVDLQSRNGTYLNGARIHGGWCRGTGDLRAGDVWLQILPIGPRGDELFELPSLQSRRVLDLCRRAAPSGVPVFIHGETGTGKEGIARRIHRWSGRTGPFVTLNAATLNPLLSGSELFGHTAGAFTGAQEARRGAFEQADRGTLFLDEVADLPPSVQAELLRVLENGEVRPLGSSATRRVQVRLITATHADLFHRVRQGTFREDLLHRIWVLPVELSPLRERPGDLDAIVDGFLARQVPRRRISDQARRRLREYHWPGNIRELLNVLERSCLLARGRILSGRNLDLRPSASGGASRELRELILRTYQAQGGRVAPTARALGIRPMVIRRAVQSDSGPLARPQAAEAPTLSRYRPVGEPDGSQ